MKDESHHALAELKRALARLQEAVRYKKSDIVRDAAIKRFEFTFELLWKALRIFLEHDGIVVNTPRDSIRAAFQKGWIRDEASFLKMMETRNKLVHTYNEDEAEQVYKLVKMRFVKSILSAVAELEKH